MCGGLYLQIRVSHAQVIVHVRYTKHHIGLLKSKEHMNALQLAPAVFLTGCAKGPNTIQSLVHGMLSVISAHVLLSSSMKQVLTGCIKHMAQQLHPHLTDPLSPLGQQLLALADHHELQQLLEEQERLRKEVVTRGRAYGKRLSAYIAKEAAILLGACAFAKDRGQIVSYESLPTTFLSCYCR